MNSMVILKKTRFMVVALATWACLSWGQALASEEVTTTPIGEVKRGTLVTLAGTVDRVLDTDEFRLADETGSIRVYVGPNWVPAQVGEAVTVHGFVDRGLGPLELYARTLTDSEGRVFTFEHRYD